MVVASLGLMQTSHQDVTGFCEVAESVLVEMSTGNGWPYYGGLGLGEDGWIGLWVVSDDYVGWCIIM